MKKIQKFVLSYHIFWVLSGSNYLNTSTYLPITIVHWVWRIGDYWSLKRFCLWSRFLAWVIKRGHNVPTTDLAFNVLDLIGNIISWSRFWISRNFPFSRTLWSLELANYIKKFSWRVSVHALLCRNSNHYIFSVNSTYLWMEFKNKISLCNCILESILMQKLFCLRKSNFIA